MSDQTNKKDSDTVDKGTPTGSDINAVQVDRKLLEILVCPVTKGPLEYHAENQELISRRADLAYPIHDGVPLMTPEAARPLSEAERARAKATKR